MAVLINISRSATAAIFLIASMTVHAAYAAPLKLYEKKIQSGLVYHFLKNTEWPDYHMASARDPLHVCIYGKDPFEGYLEPMAGRTAQKRTISLRVLRSASEIQDCHAVVIGVDKAKELKKLLAYTDTLPVLTMSNIPDFNQRGGMIEFGRKSDNIAVYVNQEAVRDVGLRIQDRMLALAESH